jgi:superfamily I DNA/RNA helicase
VNVVISEGFLSDLTALSKEHRQRAWSAIDKLVDSPNVHGGGLQTKKMKGFDIYEIRASLDLRIIARRDGEDLCCVRVNHHDKALKAGAQGRLGVQPDVDRLRTLAAETDAALASAPATMASPTGSGGGAISPLVPHVMAGPLAHLCDAELRGTFGLPDEWIPALRSLRTQEQFADQALEEVISEQSWFALAALFPPTPVVSTGAAPTYRVPSVDVARAFAGGVIAELEFNLPASSWAIVKRSRPGPIFVRGGPGSGKSLLGLYRALHGLDHPPMLGRAKPRVLYATFTRTLAEDARQKVILLRGSVPAELEIATVDSLVHRFAPNDRTTTYDESLLSDAWAAAIARALDAKGFTAAFIRSEIEDVAIARGLRTREDYLAVSRTGRSRRLARSDREIIWTVYEHLVAILAERRLRSLGLARIAALDVTSTLSDEQRYDLVVVDEVQDLPTAALGVVIQLARGTGSERDVTLIGDGGQSIYRAGFRWADVGLRLGGGNVVTLSNCERSTAQIMRFAAALAGRAIGDQDEDASRVPTRQGPLPRVRRNFSDREDQRAWLVADIRARLKETNARRIAIIARTKAELDRVSEALTNARIPNVDYGDADFHRADAVRCVTAHSAKGLEFGDVYVIGADDGSFPLRYADLNDAERAEKVGIDARLLFVAVTRARDKLTVLTGTHPSPFLEPAFSQAEVSDAAVSI